MQAQVVNLLQEVDHWKQKATALEGEKKGSSGNTSKLQKQIDTLTDQVCLLQLALMSQWLLWLLP